MPGLNTLAIVLKGRDPTIGIESAIGGRLNNAEGHAGVDALEWQGQLGAAPQDLLDIDRVRAAPDPEHAQPPAIQPDWSSPPPPSSPVSSRLVRRVELF